jgi:hypothetical protein
MAKGIIGKSLLSGLGLSFIVSFSGCAVSDVPLVGGLFEGETSPQPVQTTGSIQTAQASESEAGFTRQNLRAEALCPPIDIRDGTSNYRIFARGMEGEEAGVQYQASVTETARDCTPNGNRLDIKVGVAGRVLTGPKGGPGNMNLPVRIAVVKRTTGDVTYSELFTVPVSITAESPTSLFTKVETITIDMPTSQSESIIYAGFDLKDN